MNDYPSVSICMPTYNRNHFKPLILNNLLGQDYPKDKLEFSTALLTIPIPLSLSFTENK